MYSIHKWRKSVVPERFTSASKNVYNDELDNIVNEYNNTYHRTIKMKLVDVKYNT